MRGDPPIERTGEEKLVVRETDLPLLRELMAEKDCDYQISEGRDLFCTAASRLDRTAVSSDAYRTLAPTSLALCLTCGVPDSDYLCSHLHHPRVLAEEVGPGHRNFQRTLEGAFCDLNKSELGDGAGCHPGGNTCWERAITAKKAANPAVPYSPRDLPVALDFLNEVWRRAFSGKHLLVMKSVESTIGLALPCSTREEFRSRLTELADLFKLMTIDDDQLQGHKTRLNKDKTFDRMTAALEQLLAGSDSEIETAIAAIAVLRSINQARVGLQHSGAADKLSGAMVNLGVSYPIEDYGEVWKTILVRATEAVSAIRKAIQTVMP